MYKTELAQKGLNELLKDLVVWLCEDIQDPWFAYRKSGELFALSKQLHDAAQAAEECAKITLETEVANG